MSSERRTCLTHTSAVSASAYDAAVSIPGELERARHLALAADEPAAKELLLSLMPQIEQEDRDDLMLQALAQLGELYLVRTAYDGVREGTQQFGIHVGANVFREFAPELKRTFHLGN